MAITLAPIVYVLSYYLLSYYTYGDQVWYTKLYQALNGANIDEVLILSYNYVGGQEPISAYILWLGANLDIDKNIYVSLLNVVLIISLFFLLRQYRVKILMIGLFLTNFYIVVLMTSAERLKISYIFLILAMQFADKKRFLFLLSSPFAHLQNIILLSLTVLIYFEDLLKDFIFNKVVKKRGVLSLIMIVVVVTAVILYLLDNILNKASSYIAQDIAITELINLVILAAIAFYVSKKRFRIFLIVLPSIPLIMSIGGTRFNMIAITLIIYLLMEERKLHHPLIYLLMAYFSIKSIPFVNNIILYGDGFAGYLH